MKNTYFTVGPSQLYPTVKNHLLKAIEDDVMSLSHRSKVFQGWVKEAKDRLRQLLTIPTDHEIFFLGSGTEGMERVIENTVKDSSFHLVNGAFSKRFYQTAKQLGKNASKAEVAPGTGFDFAKISPPKKAEIMCFTHNETSCGVMLPTKDLQVFIRRYPKILTAIDIVSSAPYASLDFRLFDCVFFSVQKGFGLPAGLGVIVVSPRAIEKASYLQKKGMSIGSYHSFLELKKYADKWQTPETPNVLAIYLLNRVIDDFLKVGIAKIRQETDQKAKLLYSRLAKQAKFELFVKDIAYRSPTTLVAAVRGGSLELVKALKAKGLLVGAGYGDNKEKHIRIGNFPATSLAQVKKLIAALG